MIHYILSNPILSIIIGFVLAILIFVILGIITLALAHIAKNKTPVKIGLITLLLTFIVPLIVALTPIVIYMSSTTEVQYGEWKEIYTNELDADVKLKLHSPIYDFVVGLPIELTAGKPLDIKPQELKPTKIGTLIIQKGNTTVTRRVKLNNESFTSDGDISEYSKIVKVEYRPIEGYTNSAYGQSGDFIKLDNNGEVRVTLEPSNDEKQLNKLLE
jgi:hypothetical protein